MFSLPTIPDNVYKILLALSLIGFYFSLTSDFNILEADLKNSEQAILKSSTTLDSLYKIGDEMDILTARLKEIEDTLDYVKRFGTDDQVKALSDSSVSLYRAATLQHRRFRGITASDDLNRAKNLTRDSLNGKKNLISNVTYYLSLAVFIFSLYHIARKTSFEEKIALMEFELKHAKPYCQSCGKRFNSMIKCPKDTNGNEVASFCDECHDGTNFIDMSLSVEEVYKVITNKQPTLSQKEKNKIKNQVSQLERWASAKYF